MDRRYFLKTCLAAGLAAGNVRAKRVFGMSRQGARGIESPNYDAKCFPTRLLGRTGVRVPVIGFGGGSRFCRVEDLEKSLELLNYALDHGLYYWDTAHQYGGKGFKSEERYGLILKYRRCEVFLATKTSERTYDGAMRQLEESLKRLKTDYLDVYQIHAVESMADVEAIGAKRGARVRIAQDRLHAAAAVVVRL